MIPLELSQYSLREKLQIMQSIWEDLRSHVDGIDVPASHRKILDDRRQRAERGDTELVDWEKVRST